LSEVEATDFAEELESRSRASYHEAGHLVAAIWTGRDIQIVELAAVPDETGRWRGRTGFDASIRNVDDFEAVAIVFWAGSISERVHVMSRHASMPKVSELITAFGAVLDVANLKLSAAQLGVHRWSERTRRASALLVRDRWTEIEAWADCLERDATLVHVGAGGWKLGPDHYDTLDDARSRTNGIPHDQWMRERVIEHVMEQSPNGQEVIGQP